MYVMHYKPEMLIDSYFVSIIITVGCVLSEQKKLRKKSDVYKVTAAYTVFCKVLICRIANYIKSDSHFQFLHLSHIQNQDCELLTDNKMLNSEDNIHYKGLNA